MFKEKTYKKDMSSLKTETDFKTKKNDFNLDKMTEPKGRPAETLNETRLRLCYKKLGLFKINFEEFVQAVADTLKQFYRKVIKNQGHEYYIFMRNEGWTKGDSCTCRAMFYRELKDTYSKGYEYVKNNLDRYCGINLILIHQRLRKIFKIRC